MQVLLDHIAGFCVALREHRLRVTELKDFAREVGLMSINDPDRIFLLASVSSVLAKCPEALNPAETITITRLLSGQQETTSMRRDSVILPTNPQPQAQPQPAPEQPVVVPGIKPKQEAALHWKIPAIQRG
jgi:hypothetical protein